MQLLNNESANAPLPVTVHRVGASGAGDHAGFPLRHVPYGQEPRQKLDVYLPRKARVKSTIVFLYGGGWVSGARWYYRLFGRAMAARGHVVVIPDYRLFPQVRFPTFNEDAALAVKWTSDNLLRLGGHPSRLFLMGHSAGAHISVTLALDGSYLAKHDLSPADIAGVVGLAGPYTLDPLKWKGVKDIFASSSGRPDAARPIKLVRAGAPSMLLLHGERDRVAGAHASTRLAEALRLAGTNARAILYPKLGHFEILASLFPGWRWRSPVLKDVEDFIASPQTPRADQDAS
jgi:acetyl esterase/lipase